MRLTPAISSFAPQGVARLGVSVAITGTNFSGATSVKLNGIAAPFTVNCRHADHDDSAGQRHDRRRSPSRHPRGTATSTTSFTVAPRITSFTPANGRDRDSVTINGANFTGDVTVTFNGTGGRHGHVKPADQDHGDRARRARPPGRSA